MEGLFFTSKVAEMVLCVYVTEEVKSPTETETSRDPHDGATTSISGSCSLKGNDCGAPAAAWE